MYDIIDSYNLLYFQKITSSSSLSLSKIVNFFARLTLIFTVQAKNFNFYQARSLLSRSLKISKNEVRISSIKLYINFLKI